MPRTYVNNAYNRSVGRVGLPVGSAVISKNTVGGINTKTYVDNAYNRQIGRVGMPHGSAVMSKYSDGPIQWTYMDTDRKYRPASPQGINIPSHPTLKYTDHESRSSKDVKHALRDSHTGEHHLQYPARPETKVCDRGDRFGIDNYSKKSASKLSNTFGRPNTCPDKVERGIGAEIVEEIKQKETDIEATRLFHSDLQDGDFHEILMCRICHTDVQCASITPCGHRFCTHCILQWLEGRQSCPVCRNRLREADLIQDKDFDRIVGYFGSRHQLTTNKSGRNMEKEIEQYKHEIKQLKTQLQELKEKEAVATQQVQHLQEELQNNEQRGQQLNSELAKTKLEVSNLLENILRLQMFEALNTDQERQLQDYKENILPEKENIISELSTGVAQISDALHAKQNEVECLNDQIQHLHQYVELCYNLNDQLKNYQENVVPEKNNTISELRSHVEKLNDDIAALKRFTTPVDKLEALPDTNLGRAIQKLQHFYDREYRSRYDLTDRIETLLQTRLACVMNELCKEHDIGDQLGLVIITYTSMVQENSNLHRSLKTKQDEIQQLKTELRQTKLTKRHTEQRLKYTPE